jgi:hypothetical protein
VHFLGIFHINDKPRTADDYDNIVCAEFPDPLKQPLLFQKVKQHMVHNKCGKNDINGNEKRCLNDKGECSKHFPFDFIEHTRGTHIFNFIFFIQFLYKLMQVIPEQDIDDDHLKWEDRRY